MKVVAFLPAKGSSERIESKNLKLLNGKPLFLYTLEKLLECDFLNEVYLDTDSDEIIDLASETGCKVMRRDPAYASNKTDGHQLFLNEVKHADADIYVQILCTSPFINKSTIKKGIDILIENNQYDSVVLVKKDKQYTWNGQGPVYDKFHIPNSVDLPDTIIETMGMYIVRRETALATQRRYGDNVYLLEASPIEAIDVNYPDEFELANIITMGLHQKEAQYFNNLKHILSSPMLSDILDDLELNGVISGYKLNLEDKKILGRAKTLKLRSLRDGEDFRGIYDALDSYSTIVANDIIAVENECATNAYFGGLNAAIAVRSGASGAIIGGVTRDSKEVKALDFPVFSKGYNCQDVRKRATVESINKTVTIEDVTIKPGDLIFGDYDGIVVIPKEYEDEIIRRAMDTIQKERSVSVEIIKNTRAKDIVGVVGEF
ncbi:cytidyltransferase [Cohnella lubricantis]|uniref:Cytidyltransferase n=1 Tax=Cohnella lubricantis TaxID=2163172 RepID=A0A841T8Y1_9BACL|nr:cytidyltransferase [Cohnella lubricantis]MBB6677392.1 cytidyltransferase [Cohnella lubricantis]MBP2118717.1 CMP-N-acetylneuraminic acid synthetase/regulator of RNase E activity RraA [Cohnella lubricantis]